MSTPDLTADLEAMARHLRQHNPALWGDASDRDVLAAIDAEAKATGMTYADVLTNWQDQHDLGRDTCIACGDLD